MIPQQVFDDINSSVQIERIIGNEITLEKSGANYIGKCPFHDEKSASFTVSASKNMFKCFGCGVGGDAVKFIEKLKGISYIEAIRFVASSLNIEIIEEVQTTAVIERNARFDDLRKLNRLAQAYFVANLKSNETAQSYIRSRITEESIETFQLGFAPQGPNALFRSAREAGFLEENILLSGLISRNEKTGTIYEFFQDRITFPVIDPSGTIIGFSGRKLPNDNQNIAKYLNTCETILYSKKKSVYGLRESLRGLKSYNYAILVEGPVDVITMHQLGFNNTVSCLGTAVNEAQLLLIQKRVPKILILFDGDDPGQKATLLAARLAIKLGLFVEMAVLPEKQDPASMWTTPDQASIWITDNRKDFILAHSVKLMSEAANDPFLMNEAIKELTLMISHYPKDAQEIHVGNISDPKRLKPKLLFDRLALLNKEALTPDEKDVDQRLPPGVSITEFIKYGFYEYNNEYFFGTKSSREKVSNFIMNPIFHINSIFESKRIYEITNIHGIKHVVNLDMQEMTSLQAFQRNVEGKGNYLFQGTAIQFNKLKAKLYEKTRTCNEITVLGWQKEGFWAWANGIFTENGFEPIDEFGVCEFKGNHYFIPAFSSIYIQDRKILLDERKFIFKDRNITITEWSDLFIKVYGDNAKMGIAFWIATTFRDHLLHTFKNFPLLNMFGPKGSGKSQFARSMTCLYGIGQTPFNVHNGTKAGLAEHLQQFSNAFAWIDEYKNALDFDKIETLKSIYDAIGRSRMNMDKGKKKETTAVNGGVMLSGQEMPTADVALFTRVIFLLFNKTMFTDEDKTNYDLLKLLEEDGLSHFTNMLLSRREYFVKHFYNDFQDSMRDFNAHFASDPVEDRILRSVVTIVSSFKTISSVIPDFPFDYEGLKSIAFDSIRIQNDQINQSNELGQFWNALESMFDENILLEKWHFRIDNHTDLELLTGKRAFVKSTEILKFKYNAIYNLYAQTLRKQGLKPLPSDTLRYYLSNQANYLGVQRGCNFTETKYSAEHNKVNTERQNTSAMCFIYNKEPVNLSRSLDTALDIPGFENEKQITPEPKSNIQKNLPF
jgi:DNA primase catalytic core